MSWEDRPVEDIKTKKPTQVDKGRILREINSLSRSKNLESRKLENEVELLKNDILRLTRELSEAVEKIEQQRKQLCNINGVIRFLAKIRMYKNNILLKIRK